MTQSTAIELPGPGKLEFTFEELMASHTYEEPLVAGDVLCHGGFIGGQYVSPRTLVRVPAIRNWQQRLRDEKQPLLDLPRAYVPPQYPSYEQAKLLIQEGVKDPITRALTIISIVEGFGARIRDFPRPDFHKEIKEDIGGTAIAHLATGLYEAHARDEAGHRTEGGHKQMWEAARDLGLNKPEIPGDVLMQMMSGGGRRRGSGKRLYPALTERMEAILTIMANVMIVEIFAEDVFEWGKRLLGDPEISANPAAASGMVANIQSDEKPHVEYLRTALSEIRARTLLGADGRELPGHEVIDRIFETQLRGIASARPEEQREQLRRDIHEGLKDEARATELRRKFESLDSGWVFPRGENEKLDLLLVPA